MLTIRPMTNEHVDLVVKVHMLAFPGFFLTELGPRFLRVLYTGLIEDLTGITYVALKENRLVGFVAGTSHPAGLYKRLIRNSLFKFAIASIPAVIRNPGIMPRLLGAFNRPAEQSAGGKMGTLMSIAVLPENQGSGVGKLLVKQFLDHSRQDGVEKVDLTTDYEHNLPAQKFYESLGFTPDRIFVTPHGRKMIEYVISPSNPGS